MELKTFKRDSSTAITEVTGSILRGPCEERDLYIVIARDVTEQRLSEKNIRESEERYRLIFNKVGEWILLFN